MSKRRTAIRGAVLTGIATASAYGLFELTNGPSEGPDTEPFKRDRDAAVVVEDDANRVSAGLIKVLGKNCSYLLWMGTVNQPLQGLSDGELADVAATSEEVPCGLDRESLEGTAYVFRQAFVDKVNATAQKNAAQAAYTEAHDFTPGPENDWDVVLGTSAVAVGGLCVTAIAIRLTE